MAGHRLEEDVATVGHPTRAQARIEALTMHPRPNSKTTSTELDQPVKPVFLLCFILPVSFLQAIVDDNLHLALGHVSL